jgi:hypothetical protein
LYTVTANWVAAFTDLFHASEHHHPDPAHSQDGSPKKINSKTWRIFRPQKAAAKPPRLPCKPPRFHHQKTAKNILFLQNPL